MTVCTITSRFKDLTSNKQRPVNSMKNTDQGWKDSEFILLKIMNLGTKELIVSKTMKLVILHFKKACALYTCISPKCFNFVRIVHLDNPSGVLHPQFKVATKN